MIPSDLQAVADELDNWARWGKERVNGEGVPEPSIWDAWITFKGYVAGWGLSLAEQYAASRGEVVVAGESSGPPPIDPEQAVKTDQKMQYLADCYPRTFLLLRTYFCDWDLVRKQWSKESDALLLEAMYLFRGLDTIE